MAAAAAARRGEARRSRKRPKRVPASRLTFKPEIARMW
jgi:hypothetical protein